MLLWSGVLFGIIVIRIIANFFQNYTLAIIEGNFERDLKLSLFEKILKLPMSFFVDNDTGTLMSRILNDSANSTGLFRDLYLVFYSSIIRISSAIVSMLYLDWVLTCVGLIILPILFFVSHKMNSKMAKESQKLSSAFSNCSKELKESLDAIETVKIDNLYLRVLKSFKTAIDNCLNINIAINKYGAMAGGFMTGIVSFAPILVFILGTFRVIDGQTSVGNVVAISSFITYLFMPLQEIAMSKMKMQKPKAMWEKITKLLNEKEEQLEGNKFQEFNLKMKNISFSYDKKSDIFNNVNLIIKNGESIGIAGETGIGKSTLFKLIAKFYDIDKGNIYIDNQELYTVSTEDLRSKIAYISRNTYIFNGTVLDNIVFKNKYSLFEIKEALRIACLESVFELDSIVGTEGKALSDGQRVRLAIARAVLKNPSLFLIDEALTTLDPLTEEKILKNLKEKFPFSTFVIISHRDSIFKYMDSVFVFDNRGFLNLNSYNNALKSKEYKKLFSLE